MLVIVPIVPVVEVFVTVKQRLLLVNLVIVTFAVTGLLMPL
jgi:hypothetical protein